MHCHGCLQVASHNAPTDCWLSFNGGVYDVTQLLQVMCCYRCTWRQHLLVARGITTQLSPFM
jgi:hypothetical protein